MSVSALKRQDQVGNQLITQQLRESEEAIAQGDEGRAVQFVERMLEQAGYETKRDGRFDLKTKKGLETFQKAIGLKPSGELDQKSFEALKNVQHSLRKHHQKDYFVAGQQSGRIGRAEERLKRLGYETGKTDGVFSAETEQALEAFKKDQDKLESEAGNLSEASQKALRRETEALAHNPYQGRDTKGVEKHRALNTRTAKAAKKQQPIARGDESKVVAHVQRHLKAAGYDPKRTDGVFDERTEAAVKAFQRQAGLEANGRVGNGTWSKLRDSVILGKNAPMNVGEKSAKVKRLEETLRQLGHKNVKADGLFDQATRKASEKFEDNFPGLGKKGGVGENQLERMHQVANARKDPGSGPMLKKGYRGKPVRELQERLKNMGFDPGKPDGVFGSKTQKAVKDFQHAFGLESDGVVGKASWRMLGKDVRGEVNKPGSGGGGGGGSVGNVGSVDLPGVSSKLDEAAAVARSMGLTVTSTTGGTHAPGSYHYSGRAIDIAGSPDAMARFYRYYAGKNPTELFYDPLGGIKYGNQIGAIGGHSDHVHIAF